MCKNNNNKKSQKEIVLDRKESGEMALEGFSSGKEDE